MNVARESLMQRRATLAERDEKRKEHEAEQREMKRAGIRNREFDFIRILRACRRDCDKMIVYLVQWSTKPTWHTAKELGPKLRKQMKESRDRSNVK